MGYRSQKSRRKTGIGATGVCRKSFKRAGRLIPDHARGIKSRRVRLAAGDRMHWHSTLDREELLFALQGRVCLEVAKEKSDRFGGDQSGPVYKLWVEPGQCVFLPTRTVHRVLNLESSTAAYIYVTAPVESVA